MRLLALETRGGGRGRKFGKAAAGGGREKEREREAKGEKKTPMWKLRMRFACPHLRPHLMSCFLLLQEILRETERHREREKRADWFVKGSWPRWRWQYHKQQQPGVSSSLRKMMMLTDAAMNEGMECGYCCCWGSRRRTRRTSRENALCSSSLLFLSFFPIIIIPHHHHHTRFPLYQESSSWTPVDTFFGNKNNYYSVPPRVSQSVRQ